MLSKKEFRKLLNYAGEPVTFRQAKPPQTSTPIKALIQTIGSIRPSDAIVNAYGVTGYSLQFAAEDVPSTPEKYDEVVTADGRRLVLDSVVPVNARTTGERVSYLCYVKGK